MKRMVIMMMVLGFGFAAFNGAASAHDGQGGQQQGQLVALLGSADDLKLPDTDLGETERDRVLNIIFTLTGSLATIFIIVGGLRYVLAAGNSEKIQQAKNTILYAVVGLLVTIFALVIVNFVIGSV